MRAGKWARGCHHSRRTTQESVEAVGVFVIVVRGRLFEPSQQRRAGCTIDAAARRGLECRAEGEGPVLTTVHGFEGRATDNPA